jgi:hypothetical protein
MMRAMSWRLKPFIAVPGFLLAVISFSSCGMCGEEQIAEAYSPNKSYLARAYVRNCGATTGFVTHANLRSRWSWFGTSWKGTIDDGEVFDNACRSKVNFVWKDETSLEIQYEACAVQAGKKDPAWMKNESWGEVKIMYSVIPRQDPVQ